MGSEPVKAEQMHAVLSMLIVRKNQVEAALKRQAGEGWTFDHIFDKVAKQQCLFFWNEDSCAVLEVRDFPGERVLHVFLGSGSTEGLLRLYEGVAEWGQEINASSMTTLCRIGFLRKLKNHGWKQKQVYLTKEL